MSRNMHKVLQCSYLEPVIHHKISQLLPKLRYVDDITTLTKLRIS
jgi:hypothetical protein